MDGATRVDRRTVLRGLVSGALLVSATACASPHTGVGSKDLPTFSSLLTDLPFSAAHRGGGGDWPEMTAFAYEQAVRLRHLHALEVSVCLSSDGVLVCSHDPSLKRVTGLDVTVADHPWSELSTLLVQANATTDPSQPSQPLSRLEQVLEHLNDHVLFIEPKVTAAEQPLLDLLSRTGQPERIVWKQYVNSGRFSAAKQRGFGTWGYALNQPSHNGVNLSRLASSSDIDLLGAPLSEDDGFVTAVVDAARQHGKKTMAWAVGTSTQRQRALGLGCSGLMVSRPTELVS